MMSEAPARFYFVTTEDGSQSLRFQTPGDDETPLFSEAMHSLKGAFSETDYIYGTAVRQVLSSRWEPSFISLGLGLGYIEILTTGLAAQHSPHSETEQIESFEIDADLREYFAKWIQGDDQVPNQFAKIYDDILARTAALTAVPGHSIKGRLKNSLLRGRLLLRGELTTATEFQKKFTGFLFDAFSAKSTPNLWQEDFLTRFLQTTATPNAVFATYACTGALKRALRGCEFQLKIREGFASKRDSTYAVREPKSEQ